jgi:hypothetical protein
MNRSPGKWSGVCPWRYEQNMRYFVMMIQEICINSYLKYLSLIIKLYQQQKSWKDSSQLNLCHR